MASTFAEGQEVEIRGLKGARQYNGVVGKVTGPVRNGRYPIKIEGREKPFNLKAANLVEVVYEVSNEIESMFSAVERKLEIDRILAAFKLDPFAVLGLPYNCTGVQIQKHFRRVSLKCHPDKVAPGLRDTAQEAFAKLQAAKSSLLKAKTRLLINEMVDTAKRRVLAVRKAAAEEAARSAGGGQQAQPAARKLTDAEKLLKLLERDKREEEERKRESDILLAGGPDPIREAEKDPVFHDEVRVMVREMMIEREWRKVQLRKAAEQAEKDAHTEKKEKIAEMKQIKKKQEAWVEGRERRVGNWRDFHLGRGKKKDKKKKKRKRKFGMFKTGKKLEIAAGDKDYQKRLKVEKEKFQAL